MDPRPSQQKAVGSLVLDYVASDFCLKICNLALEANLAHSFLRLSLVPLNEGLSAAQLPGGDPELPYPS